MPRSRQAVLAAILLSPKRAWYRSDLARHLGVAPSSLTRELTALAQAGLLKKRTEGRHVYYEIDAGLPVYPELRGLFAKTVGIVDVLREALTSIGAHRVPIAFVYGSWARGAERSESDVDLFIVSQEPLSRFARSIRSAEEKLGRAVQVTLYTPPDLLRRLTENHHFVRDVLGGPKLFIAGGKDDLDRIAGSGKRGKARARQEGTRGTSQGRSPANRRRASTRAFR
jgi:predicted nucleotidyltransferase